MARVMILKKSDRTIRVPRSRHIFVVSMIFLWMSGCSRTAIKMEGTERAHLHIQEEIEALHYPTDHLTVMAPDESIGLGGMAGSRSEVGSSEGKQMIEAYGLEDPSGSVKERFVSGLKANATVTNIQSTEAPLSFEEPDELKKIFARGMVLDFKTDRWALSSPNIRGADVIYSARARLIRLEDSKILWQGRCGVTAPEAKGTSNAEEMIIDAGDLLKTKMDEAADHCAKALLAEFFGKAENRMVN